MIMYMYMYMYSFFSKLFWLLVTFFFALTPSQVLQASTDVGQFWWVPVKGHQGKSCLRDLLRHQARWEQNVRADQENKTEQNVRADQENRTEKNIREQIKQEQNRM